MLREHVKEENVTFKECIHKLTGTNTNFLIMKWSKKPSSSSRAQYVDCILCRIYTGLTLTQFSLIYFSGFSLCASNFFVTSAGHSLVFLSEHPHLTGQLFDSRRLSLSENRKLEPVTFYFRLNWSAFSATSRVCVCIARTWLRIYFNPIECDRLEFL